MAASHQLWEPNEKGTSAALKTILPKLETGGKVLVPGVRGYDALELSSMNRKTIALATTTEAAKTAKDFEAKLNSVQTIRDMNHNAEKFKRLEFRCESFFKQDDKFDLVWDYGYFCSLDPKLHKEWALTIERIIAPTGQLAIYLWPHDLPKNNANTINPPFSAEIHDIKLLLFPFGFECLHKLKLESGATVAVFRRPGACPEFPPSGPFR